MRADRDDDRPDCGPISGPGIAVDQTATTTGAASPSGPHYRARRASAPPPREQLELTTTTSPAGTCARPTMPRPRADRHSPDPDVRHGLISGASRPHSIPHVVDGPSPIRCPRAAGSTRPHIDRTATGTVVAPQRSRLASGRPVCRLTAILPLLERALRPRGRRRFRPVPPSTSHRRDLGGWPGPPRRAQPYRHRRARLLAPLAPPPGCAPRPRRIPASGRTLQANPPGDSRSK